MPKLDTSIRPLFWAQHLPVTLDGSGTLFIRLPLEVRTYRRDSEIEFFSQEWRRGREDFANYRRANLEGTPNGYAYADEIMERYSHAVLDWEEAPYVQGFESMMTAYERFDERDARPYSITAIGRQLLADYRREHPRAS